MPDKRFLLVSSSVDGMFSFSATASGSFVEKHSNYTDYQIDSLSGMVNGKPIVSYVHDDSAVIRDYNTVDGVDLQERDEFDKLIITDSDGITYSISDLGQATYLEFDSRDHVYGRYVGVQITPECYASGTLIRTTEGEVAVEDLAIGDVAITASGAHRPIRWLGHRNVNCRSHPRPHDIMPVRIAAHAFGDGLPARDLMLSPGHPVLVGADADAEGGHLVPIMCLINGTTIERMSVDDVSYWHVELDAHDVLLAEGLPAESYLDLGSRAWFAGADGAHYDPDMALPGMPGRCRPVAIDGAVVEAERRRLDTVFATRLASASAWPCAEYAVLPD